jgi:AcrR family transcriptional regulator
MIDEGYAAVTTRRLGAAAGVNSALVYYYFESMDGLFIELFRRGAEQSLGRLKEGLRSAQPLWHVWDVSREQTSSAITMELIALANHRKALRAEIADYARRYRLMQLDALTEVLAGYGVDPVTWPAASVLVVMAGVSRFLHIEDAFDVDIGHAETIAVVERFITDLEGPRRSDRAREGSA